MSRSKAPIPPMQVDTGPCKENIATGADADILKFPVPYIHEGDGGRYGTCSVVIVKDPESGAQKWGYHRWMVLDGQRLTGPLSQPLLGVKELNSVYRKYEARN